MNRKAGNMNSICAIVAIVALAVTLPIAVSSLNLPEPLPANSPPSEFSAWRARAHVEAISAVPHPMGSPAETDVRNYILHQLALLGIDASVREATLTFQPRGGPPVHLRVKNVVGEIDGTNPSKAVMLVAHYDSTVTSPGASDDGTGVATLLETARAIRSGPKPRNDLVFLFTDGEEAGLLGAQAFVRYDPIASKIGTVLNFDARGSTGPVVMFETAGPTGELVRQMASAVPYPLATSFSGDVYRRMPNKTDFTIFRDAGYSGLNFAFFAEGRHYHNPLDSLQNLDVGSLQEEGSSALGLARAFGNMNLPDARKDPAVYFNLGRAWLVVYSTRWNEPLAALAVGLWLFIMGWGIAKKRVRLVGLARGTFAAMAAFAATIILSLLMSRWMPALIGASQRADLPVSLCLAVRGTISLCIVAAAYRLFPRGRNVIEILVPIYACWLLVSIALTLVASGASYLFVWPTIIGLTGLTLVLVLQSGSPIRSEARLALAAATFPALILLLPAIGLVHYAMGSRFETIVSMVCMTLIVMLFAPALALFERGTSDVFKPASDYRHRAPGSGSSLATSPWFAEEEHPSNSALRGGPNEK